jgi:hypothetical protein
MKWADSDRGHAAAVVQSHVRENEAKAHLGTERNLLSETAELLV